MRTRLLVILTAVAMATMAFTAVGGVQEDVADATSQRLIVAVHELPAVEEGDTFHGAVVLDVIEDLDFLVVEVSALSPFEASVLLDDNVRYVEPVRTDWELYFTPNDSLYGNAGHWGSKRIGGEAAWDVTLGSTAVKVAMIDSGLNKGHEEYSGQSRVLQGFDFYNNDNDPDDGQYCGFHGTHTTGTAGATINNGKGIAGMSQHSILPLKIFQSKNNSPFNGCPTTTTAIVNALKYAGDQGAHLSSNSWGGGGSSSSINDAIKYAHSKGTIHVAAAGNSGPCTNCVGQPWKDNPTVSIVVSASSSNDAFASFSSQGPEVDIIAPGDDIISTTSGTSGYSTYDGTSMATPHVTGALALYIAATGNTAYSTVEGALKSTAEDLGLASDRQGSGLVRADSLVGGGGGGTTNSPPTASFTSSCTDLSCSFDGSGSTDSDGSISSYAWDFGDGSTGSGATVSHTYAAGGTYTVTLTVTDDDGATDSDSQSVSVSDGGSSGPTTLLSENFDDGAADGWTKSSLSNDLWRISGDCVTPASGSYQLAFSRPSPDCDYDVGTAEGWASAPTLDASGFGTVTLSFDHFFDVESYNGAYDTMRVQVSSDGGSSWTTIAQWDARDDTNGGYTGESFDISGHASSGLAVRFYFDSVDSVSNDFPGWYVDNVVVTAS